MRVTGWRGTVLVCGVALGTCLLAGCERQKPPAAPAITVSGITLGMSADEYRDMTRRAPIRIAGIEGRPLAVFNHDRLERFLWEFSSDKYLTVRAALKSEYPRMRCRLAIPDKLVRTAHEVCTIGSTFVLVHGAGGPGASSIWLHRDAAAGAQ